MNLHDLIGYLVHRTDVKMTNYFTKKLKPYGVTPEQWGSLVFFVAKGALLKKSWRKLLIKIKLLLLE